MTAWIGTLTGLATLCLLWPREAWPRRRRLQRELARLGAIQAPPARRDATLPWVRWVRRLPLGQLTRWTAALCPSGYRQRFERHRELARLQESLHWSDFLRAKWAAGLISLGYTGLMWLKNPVPTFALLFVVIPAVAGFLPDAWLKARVCRRQQAIERELPGIITTLAITTEAGLGLLSAVEEVAHSRRGTLAGEFRWVLDQTRIGLPQGEALEQMAARCGVADLTLFLSSLIQSFEKGSGHVVETLRAQSAEAWEKRRRQAEQLAQQASIKLFLPLGLLVFPALVIFLLGPAFLQVAEFFVSRP